MTVVYIDLLFLLNLIANYLLLLAAGRMAGAVLIRWRIGLGAAAGALYAALIFLPGLDWLAAWPCKLAAGVLLALVAYGDLQITLHIIAMLLKIQNLLQQNFWIQHHPVADYAGSVPG